MAANEYVLSLLTIVSGLAITEWIGSFYRLLTARRRVKWDWLAVAVALFATYNILYAWWVAWRALGQNPDVSLTLGDMAIRVIEGAFMFLATRASLPDAVPEEGVDLREHYASHSWLTWGGMAAGAGLLLVMWVLGDLSNWDRVFGSWRTEFGVLACLLLAVVPNRRLHVVMVPLVIVVWVASSLGWRLGA